MRTNKIFRERWWRPEKKDGRTTWILIRLKKTIVFKNEQKQKRMITDFLLKERYFGT